MQGNDFGHDDFDDALIGNDQQDSSLTPSLSTETEAARAREAAEQLQKAREHNAARIRSTAERKRKARRRNTIIVAVTSVVVVGASVPLTLAVMQEARRASHLQQTLTDGGQPAVALGFSQRKEWLDVPTAGVAFDVPAHSCSMLVGVSEQGPKQPHIRLERTTTDALEGDGGMLWCSCDEERVIAKFTDNTGASGQRFALRWSSVPASQVGGINVLSTKTLPGLAVVVDDAAGACASKAFEEWSFVGKNGQLEPIDPKRSSATSKLIAQGMEPVGMLSASRAIGVLRASAGNCYVALPQGAGSALTYRTHGEEPLTVESSQAVGWCTYAVDGTFSLWRSTQQPQVDIIVARASAEQVGGMTGLQEAAQRAGAKTMQGMLTSQDLMSDVKASLHASTIADSSIVSADRNGLPGKLHNQVLAFSLLSTGSFLPPTSPKVAVACHPEQDFKANFHSTICVQGRSQSWLADGAEKGRAAAEGPLPFWLLVLSDAEDPDAVSAAANLLAFARRMTLLGFEPTSIEGVKDLPSGALVSGRAGKKEVVAVGITRAAPWIHPLSISGTWSIDGEVRAVPVADGKSIELHSQRPLGANAQTRRVVVWRK